MKWLVVFFVGMTFAVALPRRLAMNKAMSDETSTSSTVEYRSGDVGVPAYLTLPEGGRSPFPAIVVAHDYHGLDDFTRGASRLVAIAADAVVLAVDLHRAQTKISHHDAGTSPVDFPRDRAMQDLAAAISYLKSRDDVDPTRIGVIGWGVGATLALRLASDRPDLKAVVVCGWLDIPDLMGIDQIEPPILGVFGGATPELEISSVLQLEHSLRQRETNVRMVIYPSAKRAFMDPANRGAYRSRDASNAWSNINAFLTRNLARR